MRRVYRMSLPNMIWHASIAKELHDHVNKRIEKSRPILCLKEEADLF